MASWSTVAKKATSPTRPPDKRAPVDQWGGRTTASGVWIGPRRAAGTPNPGSANQQVRAEAKAAGLADPGFGAAADWVKMQPSVSGANYSIPKQPGNSGGGGSGGRGGYGYGGGGGGGGVSAAAAAQAQMDFLQSILGGKQYTLDTTPYDAMRAAVTGATAQDQAAATGAYDSLDAYLAANQSNPYANVQLQRAARAPDMNPYLATQGVDALAPQGQNTEDGGYGAFQNVLALLGAAQGAATQSRGAESQMARTYTGQQIGAADNAYLANIQGQQAAAQQKLADEKRAALLQLATLIGQGAKAPDMAALGLA